MNKEKLVREYIKKKRYFNLAGVMKETGLTKQVTKNYLYAFKAEGIVFSAGRGVYSSVAEEFHPEEKSRVAKIRQLLKKQYPELDFLIWNTLYFQPYYHHQQTHNITFVEVEADAMRPVADSISRNYRFVMIEKASRVAPKGFDITRDPIVVRLLIKGSPRKGHAPSLEKMLVDLFVIKDKYSTMPDGDYWELWRSIDELFRINVSALIAYAKTVVRVPTPEGLSGDKMTAASPKTIGIPLNKKRSMEVLKQVIDLGGLFKIASDIEDIRQTFLNTAEQENDFRGTSYSIDEVLDDVTDIAFKYSQSLLRGADNSFPEIALINEGLSRVGNHLMRKIDPQDLKAVFARIAYIASALKNEDKKRLIKTADLSSIKDMALPGKYKILERLKVINPDAYFYWALAIRLPNHGSLTYG